MMVTAVTGLEGGYGGGAAVAGNGLVNRSASADALAGARCVGYAAVANKDLAGCVERLNHKPKD